MWRFLKEIILDHKLMVLKKRPALDCCSQIKHSCKVRSLLKHGKSNDKKNCETKYHSRGEKTWNPFFSAGELISAEQLKRLVLLCARTNRNIKACLLRVTTTAGTLYVYAYTCSVCKHVCACVGVCAGDWRRVWIKQIWATTGQRRGQTECQTNC